MSAPTFAFVVGVFYVAMGILAMLPSLVLPSRESLHYGYFLGAFAVNTPLNVIHAFMGMWGLAAWSGALSAVTFGRALALVMGAFAVAGLMAPVREALDVLPLHGHNVWLHGLSALLGAWIGFRSLARRELEHARGLRKTPAPHGGERRRSTTDRRQVFRPVAQERRRAARDRRQAEFGGSTIPAG